MANNLYKRKLRVNFETYTVKYTTSDVLNQEYCRGNNIKHTDDQFLGLCDTERKTIGLLKGLTAVDQGRVICHELGHAVDYEYHTIRSIENYYEMLAEFASVYANVIEVNQLRRKL